MRWKERVRREERNRGRGESREGEEEGGWGKRTERPQDVKCGRRRKEVAETVNQKASHSGTEEGSPHVPPERKQKDSQKSLLCFQSGPEPS